VASGPPGARCMRMNETSATPKSSGIDPSRRRIRNRLIGGQSSAHQPSGGAGSRQRAAGGATIVHRCESWSSPLALVLGLSNGPAACWQPTNDSLPPSLPATLSTLLLLHQIPLVCVPEDRVECGGQEATHIVGDRREELVPIEEDGRNLLVQKSLRSEVGLFSLLLVEL
jgi:hypothetical protein